jgi:hypothetical protein
MKKFFNWMFAAFLPTVLLCPLCAQITVVRVSGDKIYLDTSAYNRPVKKGDLFKIILSSETLINPKTGRDLGLIYNYSPEGKITEVQPLYVVGALKENVTISVGQEAVIESSSFAQTSSAPAQTVVQETTAPARPLKRYAPVEQQIISLTQGAVSGADGKNIITLSADGTITVWDRAEDKNLQQLFSYKLPIGKEPITISAKKIKEGETDQIFVTVYDTAHETISTLVLENKNNTLSAEDTMPYFVKEIGCGAEKILFAQRPFITDTKPGNARSVIYKKNSYRAEESVFSTQYNWLTGVNYYPLKDKDTKNLLYTSSTGVLRIVLKNGKRTESKKHFATSANRIKYKQKLVRFYPSLQVFGETGNATLVAVENTAKLGLLSDTFGQYDSGKLHWLSYEQGKLTDKEVTELDGVLYDTACTDEAILTAEVLPDGTSTVVEILR